jgi:hypothetical protein
MKVTVEVKNGMVQDVFVVDHLGNEVNFVLEIIDHDNRDEDSAEWISEDHGKMEEKMRQIEYYRLWGGDSGTWDTDFIGIPSDTPDDKILAAVHLAVDARGWNNEVPVIIGIYSIPTEEDAISGCLL